MPIKIVFSDEQSKKIANLYLGGSSIKQIAKTTGFHSETIKKSLIKDNIKLRSNSDYQVYKKCIHCLQIKETCEFKVVNRNNKKCITSKCKVCYSNKIKQYSKTHYYKNRDRIINYSKQYAKSHRNQINKTKKNYLINNPGTRIHKTISSSINKHIRSIKSCKNGKSIFSILPYTKFELINYLESKFEPWMNWSNYGVYNSSNWKDDDQTTWTWQLDHIIPQSKLPYNSVNDDNFKKCWSLNNLRPYCAKLNIIEGNRRIVNVNK